MAGDMCPRSGRLDGKHNWCFDGDDPYVVCSFCNEMRDALTDRVILQSRLGAGQAVRTSSLDADDFAATRGELGAELEGE